MIFYLFLAGLYSPCGRDGLFYAIVEEIEVVKMGGKKAKTGTFVSLVLFLLAVCYVLFVKGVILIVCLCI